MGKRERKGQPWRTVGEEGKERQRGVEALAAQKARMQAKKEERDEETGFFQLGQVGASNLGGPQPPSENNLHAAAAAAAAAAANDAVLIVVFSTRSRLPQVRDKKGDRRHKYAGALGHPLSPLIAGLCESGTMPREREREIVREKKRTYNDERPRRKPEGRQQSGSETIMRTIGISSVFLVLLAHRLALALTSV